MLDPESHEGVALLARELGADARDLAARSPPPAVARLLARWLPLAQRRAEADGWSRRAPSLRARALELAAPLLNLAGRRASALAELTESTGPPPIPDRRPAADLTDDLHPDAAVSSSNRGHPSMFGKKSPGLTEQDVLDALKGVKDPDLHRDLVDLGMIKDIQIGDGTVALTVNLTTPACPLKAKIERDVREALDEPARRRAGPYTITMTAEVRGKGIAEKGDIPGVKNVIAVGSGKGGVGKSTMAAAIAYGLQVLRLEGRPDGRRRLRPVDPPPRRRHRPADGQGRAHPADRDRTA